MKRTQSGTVLVLLLAFLSMLTCMGSPVLYAQAQPGQGTNFNLEGKITDKAPGKLTVNMESNIIMHVSYDAQTQIHRKDGSVGSSRDLKIGAMVKVDGDLNSSGVIQAKRIDLE
jgi:Domain of unknown function (DUF5666)